MITSTGPLSTWLKPVRMAPITPLSHIVLDWNQASFSGGDDLLQNGNGVVFVEVIHHEGPKPASEFAK